MQQNFFPGRTEANPSTRRQRSTTGHCRNNAFTCSPSSELGPGTSANVGPSKASKDTSPWGEFFLVLLAVGVSAFFSSAEKERRPLVCNRAMSQGGGSASGREPGS